MIDLEEIKKRCEAVPDKLSVSNNNTYLYGALVGRVIQESGYEIAACPSKEIAEFFAHAREDIPALIAEVERLRSAFEIFAFRESWGAIDPDSDAFGLVSPKWLGSIDSTLEIDFEPWEYAAHILRGGNA